MNEPALDVMKLAFLNRNKDAFETISKWLTKLPFDVLASSTTTTEFKQKLCDLAIVPNLIIVDSASKHTLRQFKTACEDKGIARFFVVNSVVKDQSLKQVHGWCVWPCSEHQFEISVLVALTIVHRFHTIELERTHERLKLHAAKILWETNPELYSTIDAAYAGVQKMAATHRIPAWQQAKAIIDEFKKKQS